MIFDSIIEEMKERETIKNILIICGDNLINEDVRATKNTNNYKANIRIRTKSNDGRSNNLIEHGPSIKIRIDKKEADIFIKKNSKGEYYCELDRNYKNPKEITRTREYKVSIKFAEANAENLDKIYYTEEDSSEFNEFLKMIKQTSPKFKYSK